LSPNCTQLFATPPAFDHFSWRHTNIVISRTGTGAFSQVFNDVGIKKRSFCGSEHSIKPSLTLNIKKFNTTNEQLAIDFLGTTHLILGNSKQDSELFRQCAGYKLIAAMGLPAASCSLARVIRQEGANSPVFLGVYVLLEPIKKDFFSRRPELGSIQNGSAYEFEKPDDINLATFSNQLQVEWSSTGSPDFLFAANALMADNSTALASTINVPQFVKFWATEIMLKHTDGYTRNNNNSYIFNEPIPNPNSVTSTKFNFIPSGIDSIFRLTYEQPISEYSRSLISNIAFRDSAIRYQLIRYLANSSRSYSQAQIPQRIDALKQLASQAWTDPDPTVGQPTDITVKADKVKADVQQTISYLESTYGIGILKPSQTTSFNIIGVRNNHCMRPPATLSSTNNEVNHSDCSNALTAQASKWKFEYSSQPTNAINFGFTESPALFRVKSGQRCLTVFPKPDANSRYFLRATNCQPNDEQQLFYLVQRGSSSLPLAPIGFELRSYMMEDGCAHFSDAVITSSGSPAIYMASCNADVKNILTAKPVNGLGQAFATQSITK
jgi:CotH kinase protein